MIAINVESERRGMHGTDQGWSFTTSIGISEREGGHDCDANTFLSAVGVKLEG